MKDDLDAVKADIDRLRKVIEQSYHLLLRVENPTFAEVQPSPTTQAKHILQTGLR